MRRFTEGTGHRRRAAELLVLAAVVALVPIHGASASLDAGSPSISYSLTGTTGDNGWWRSDVTVAWTVSGTGLISVNGCGTTQLHGDQDGAKLKCEATFDDGSGPTTITKWTVPIDIDVTPPDVSGTAERVADSAGWYHGPVGVFFAGVDATSGVNGASCTSSTYEGPDSSTAHVSGTCADVAGNVGGSSFTLKYDATAPATRPIPAREPFRYGWYNRDLSVRFVGTDAVSGIDSCTKASYGGPTDADASVTGSCTDVAGNTKVRTFSFKYAEPFLSPKRGARVSEPPRLDWPPVARANFYNLQLWHNGKILSRWPKRSSIQLHRHWHFSGQSHRLQKGRYDWYVWPHYKGRYHKLLGHGVFDFRAG